MCGVAIRYRSVVLGWLVVVLGLLSVGMTGVGCQGKTYTGGDTNGGSELTVDEEDEEETTLGADAEDESGRIGESPCYLTISDEARAAIREEWLQAITTTIEDVCTHLQDYAVFEQEAVEVPIRVEVCGTANMYYSPDDQEIVVCGEFLEMVGEIFARYSERLGADYFSGTLDVIEGIKNVLQFAVYHEIGHLADHVLPESVAGNIEDKADFFAVKMFVDRGIAGQASDVARFYWLLAEEGIEPPYWDEHQYNRKRASNILCWLYGSDTAAFNVYVKSELLPEDRARLCTEEYEDFARGWERVLGG